MGPKDVDSGIQGDEFFGYSLALNGVGDRLAVGITYSASRSSVDPNKKSGSVQLYSFTDRNFSGGALVASIGEGYTGPKDININLDSMDFFGGSVALNAAGTKLAVGAPLDDGADNQSSNAGAVRIFSFIDQNFSGGALDYTIGSGYSSPQGVSLSSVQPSDLFGHSVAFNATGDRLAVGSAKGKGANNSGAFGTVTMLSATDTTSSGSWLSPTYGSNPSDTVTVSATDLAAQLASGTAVTLQASNDITVSRPVSVTAGSLPVGSLTLPAVRSGRSHH